MNIKRKFYFIFIIFLLTATSVFASSASFTTLSPVDVREYSVYLRGEFNARDGNLINVWFQYGEKPQELFKRTKALILNSQNSIKSQQLSGLDTETHYYYRTVLKDGSDIRYGQVLDFTTLAKDTEKKIDEDTSKNLFNYKPFSFYEIFKWHKKKEKTTKQAETEPQQNRETENSDKDTSLDKNDSEKHYNNSAAYNDELGKVIEFNKKNIKPRIKNTERTKTLNYPILLLFIVLLGIALFLIHLFFLKKKRKIQHIRSHQISDEKRKQGKYYIPVKRDLHDPKQNPNKFFEENNFYDK